MNTNSPKNQAIKRKLVDREVLCNVGPEVEFILSNGSMGEPYGAPYTWDDVENVYAVDWDELEDHLQSVHENDINELYEEFDVEDFEQLQLECDIRDVQDHFENYLDFEVQPAEIYEWWKVTSWFEEQLRNRGECTIEHAQIWGRQVTGQAIMLDHVVSEIAMQMGILDGQPNEWDVNTF